MTIFGADARATRGGEKPCRIAAMTSPAATAVATIVNTLALNAFFTAVFPLPP
jgi:hypothetical protein